MNDPLFLKKCVTLKNCQVNIRVNFRVLSNDFLFIYFFNQNLIYQNFCYIDLLAPALKNTLLVLHCSIQTKTNE